MNFISAGISQAVISNNILKLINYIAYYDIKYFTQNYTLNPRSCHPRVLLAGIQSLILKLLSCNIICRKIMGDKMSGNVDMYSSESVLLLVTKKFALYR